MVNEAIMGENPLVAHLCSLLPWQPRGLTLARIEGPVTAEVTVRERGECEITPSTDVRYPPGSTNSQRNHWLLIGKCEQFPLTAESEPVKMKQLTQTWAAPLTELNAKYLF